MCNGLIPFAVNICKAKKGLTTIGIFAINFIHIRSKNLFGGNPNLACKLPLGKGLMKGG
jgi:hypothetical protein